jgi:hypothetical protein
MQGDQVTIDGDRLPKMIRLGHVAQRRPAWSGFQAGIVPSVGDTRSG